MSSIDLSDKNLKTLKGQKIPEVVNGISEFFDCSRNLLTNLEFGPKEVQGTFNCSKNKLTSLEFGPTKTSAYYCHENKLTSLEFGPMEITHGDFHCGENQLTSIKFCPTKINGDVYLQQNKIVNFKDIHRQFKNGYIFGLINFGGNPITSHLLGLILIPKLQYIQDIGLKGGLRDASLIISNHLRNGRDVLECQEELIQKGFKEFAQL